MVGEVLVRQDLDAGAADLLLVELVAEEEDVGLDELGLVSLGEAEGPEVVLGEVLVGLDSEVEDVAVGELEVDDGGVKEGLFVDLLVQVHVEVALEVGRTAPGVEVALEGELVLVVEVAGGQVW